MTLRFRTAHGLLGCILSTAFLAGCAMGPASSPRSAGAPASVSAVEAVTAIRAAAGDGEGELSVQPLRDGRVEDLRHQAAQQEAAGDVAGAAARLDEALAIVPEDPAILQERAEVAILQGDTVTADRLAQRAYALGSQVGPLCRRHWATLQHLRQRQGDDAGAAQAQAQIEGCRVGALDRF